ncbi:50S ribosomal protein L19e [Halomarina salina]|uniref:Large ribosomal subunit protein eL19 n=1 Tax=Halomarina salina TaxID=1872699 RepID=A0ABD5RR35_9EURY|nr:50S ribosomal protein L19e [Halomarina salina]
MSDLSTQKRLAADELDVGKNRIWFDPDAGGDIADAITREDIRELIADGSIDTKREARSNSRGRARERNEKRSYGHRKGPGSRKGRKGARDGKKDQWMRRIRAQRRRLRELRDEEERLDRSEYREVYGMASGGEFDSVSDLERYVENNY